MVNITLWNGDIDVAERSFDSKEDAMRYIKTLREDGEWKIAYDGWSMTDEDGRFLIEEGEKVIWQTKRKTFRALYMGALFVVQRVFLVGKIFVGMERIFRKHIDTTNQHGNIYLSKEIIGRTSNETRTRIHHQ